MSDILARIRVTEPHGIRRFLYPLTARIPLPEGVDPHRISLSDEAGQGVPTQVAPYNNLYHLSFAVSLAPLEAIELTLHADTDPTGVRDPLYISEEGNLFRSCQERFSVDFGWDGNIESVIYDGISHLRGPSWVTLNGRQTLPYSRPEASEDVALGMPLYACVNSWVSYPIQSAETLPSPQPAVPEHLAARIPLFARAGLATHPAKGAETLIEITACKSWVRVTRDFWFLDEGDEVVFYLPLQVTSSTLFYDFGVGGGVYGKLQKGVTETVKWVTTIQETRQSGTFRWSVETAGRVDYTGTVASRQEYESQSWFHIIDTDKALAVAIVDLPDDCSSVTTRLDLDGNVQIAFRFGATAHDSHSVGVCYHFLNDVPAIAAATNPQSILLPPTVEVLAG